MTNVSKQTASVTSSTCALASDGGRGPRLRGGCLPSEGGALGTAAKLQTPPLQVVDFSTGEIASQGKISQVESINNARRIRFELQDAARDILFGFHGDSVRKNDKGYEVHHRTCTCNRLRHSATTQVVKSSTHKKAFYGGLMTCANARTCSVCAAPINERKANEMRLAANQCEAMGLQMSMLTFTVPHSSGDHIDDLIPKITKALVHFWEGNPAKKFRNKYGIVGNIRSFEVRYGGNGWHPHFHIIIFSERPLPRTKFKVIANRRTVLEEQEDGWNWILNRWQTMCAKAGLNEPNHYGMDIQDGTQAGEYITKFGSDGEILETKSGKAVTWDVADEMTKGNTKQGRKGSWSPWDLLARSVDGDLTDGQRLEAKKLFLFYARAMVGITQIKWSRGLRGMFSLGADISDEEILKREEDSADFLCHITPDEWKYIVKNKLRSVVLELAENGGSAAVARFLHSHCGTGCFDDFLRLFGERNSMKTEKGLEHVYSRLQQREDKKLADFIKESSFAPDFDKSSFIEKDASALVVHESERYGCYLTNDKVDSLSRVDFDLASRPLSQIDLPPFEPVSFEPK